MQSPFLAAGEYPLITHTFLTPTHTHAPHSLCGEGCNVENCVLPLGTCAERCAIVKAVSEGFREFIAVAVST